ncbi:hypothetical protein AB0M25_35110 [Streptomyces griseomycini]|uniref:hypothetical protein n=1 Tax=Streptomyces griseomycini TaxID=66895 RepID=UPI0034467669
MKSTRSWRSSRSASSVHSCSLSWIGLAGLSVYGGCRPIQVFAARGLLPHLTDVVEPSA